MLEAVIENQTPRTQSVAFSYALYCTNFDMRDVYNYVYIVCTYIYIYDYRRIHSLHVCVLKKYLCNDWRGKSERSYDELCRGFATARSTSTGTAAGACEAPSRAPAVDTL